MCYYVINYEQWEAPMNGRGFTFNRLCFCYTNMYNIDVGTTLTMVISATVTITNASPIPTC